MIEKQLAEIDELEARPDNTELLQSDIKLLMSSIEDLTTENKTLSKLDAEKSSVIETLTNQLHEQVTARVCLPSSHCVWGWQEQDSHKETAMQNEIEVRATIKLYE